MGGRNVAGYDLIPERLGRNASIARIRMAVKARTLFTLGTSALFLLTGNLEENKLGP